MICAERLLRLGAHFDSISLVRGEWRLERLRCHSAADKFPFHGPQEDIMPITTTLGVFLSTTIAQSNPERSSGFRYLHAAYGQLPRLALNRGLDALINLAQGADVLYARLVEDGKTLSIAALPPARLRSNHSRA